MTRNTYRMFRILLFVCYLQSLTSLAGLARKPCVDSLRFEQSNHKFNVVEMEMPSGQYKRVVAAKGQKISLKNTSMKFNGDTVSIKEIHLHGNTTLNFDRKSYSVDAAQKIKICKKGCKPLDAFYLISLSMDKNYFHNRLCFDLLQELNLFHLQYEYAEVKINGNSQGIYLMLQRPQDWSKKVADSPFIIRRGLDHVVAKEKVEKDLDKGRVKEYRKQFATIYKLIDQYSGEPLYTKLNEILHVDDYLRWLALNYIIKNGDYSDELYFYIDPETKRYRIIPWDYDDVFKPEPHEGMDVWRSRMDPSSLIFSSEDELDRAIAHDSFLYGKYLEHVSGVVNELNEEIVESIIDKLYKDLSVLYSSDVILQASSKDGYNTSLERLQKELVVVNQYFSYMRIALKK